MMVHLLRFHPQMYPICGEGRGIMPRALPWLLLLGENKLYAMYVEELTICYEWGLNAELAGGWS